MENDKMKAIEKVEKAIEDRKSKMTKEEREKLNEQKRIELARLKQAKKDEKEKQKQIAKREKNRKKQEKKEQKLNYKKEQREKHDKNKKNSTPFITAIISLGIATLVLATALTLVLLIPSNSDNSLESVYKQSFYDTVTEVDNIDVNLSKLLATKDKSAIQNYLVDVAINAELCESDLSSLPLEDENKYYTTKLVNQIGDFCKYINKKLNGGKSLTDEDTKTLVALYEANKTFKNYLQEIISDMPDDYSFSGMLEKSKGDIIIKNFNELQNLSVEYPELIYDGPFSDGKDNKRVKGISGEEINEEKARKLFVEYFSNYQIKNIENVGETNGLIPCYNVQAEYEGEPLFAEISKTGGKLIMFAYSGSCNEVNCDGASAIETATAFLSKLEIPNLKPVWTNLSNNVYTINFAVNQDDVIVYSDLIKVRVCAQTNTVIGMEATSYYTNHTDRVIDKNVLSVDKAKKEVSSNINIETERLALIPVGEDDERLSYEFSGTYDGATYYVYIDANTLRQVEMFKVIESTEGTLLI